MENDKESKMVSANQDPLAELKPLQLPNSIDVWPWAPGWYLLIITSVVIVSLGVYLWLRYRQQSLYKRQALMALNEIANNYQKNQNISQSTEALSALLKQVILVHLPREEVSQLSGKAWLKLLDSATQSNNFSQGCGSLLGNRAFQNLEQDPKAKADFKELLGVSKKLIKNVKNKHIKGFSL